MRRASTTTPLRDEMGEVEDCLDGANWVMVIVLDDPVGVGDVGVVCHGRGGGRGSVDCAAPCIQPGDDGVLVRTRYRRRRRSLVEEGGFVSGIAQLGVVVYEDLWFPAPLWLVLMLQRPREGIPRGGIRRWRLHRSRERYQVRDYGWRPYGHTLLYGNFHPDAAFVWRDLAHLHLTAREYGDAMYAAERALESSRRVLLGARCDRKGIELPPSYSHLPAYFGIRRRRWGVPHTALVVVHSSLPRCTATFDDVGGGGVASTRFLPTMSAVEEITDAKEEEKKEKNGETFEFQADVGRVMDIIINSLYSNRDVFLRELVSNAADACDKKRFLSISGSSTDVDVSDLAKPSIRIRADRDAGTITIEDTGVGMTKSELQNNLGRIAQSGTRKFVEALGEGGTGDVNLIGQFGVGFYSAYLVADRVTVVTKSMQPNSKQLRWTSDASNSYTITEDEGEEGSDPIDGSGTRLILQLKDDALEYLEPSKLESLLEHYSEFIEFPISVWKEKTEYVKVVDEEEEMAKEGEEESSDEPKEPKMKTVPKTTEGYEQMNTNKPIWLRSPSDVTSDEYRDFYQSAFRASYDEPLAHTHFSLEGQIECKSILYIPGMLPFELSRDMFDEDSRNIRLYVKRVFINDKFEDIVPRWLKFVRGVVDSQDLPLNVSREILQKSKVLSIINKRLVRKSLDMIRDIAADTEDESKYIMFWNNFGKYLKVGVIEDAKNKDDIVPLLRFYSSRSGDEYTSFDEYVSNMKENQKQIYYVTADGKTKAQKSPAAEKVRSRGYEVLYLTEPLDEIMIESVTRYKEYKLVDVSKEGLNFDDEDKEERKKKEDELNSKHKVVKEYLEAVLAGKVQRVKMTDLLSENPAALVQSARTG
ncbi:hypothetical protein ACHAXA_001360 [Cyclostephanos tholiformis]|uniref:Heat shock protein 90 n=1 Tax=Cyclostephanos tholiformis TaxID=382380 RepID=A0ABD3RDN3_9STRA